MDGEDLNLTLMLLMQKKKKSKKSGQSLVYRPMDSLSLSVSTTLALYSKNNQKSPQNRYVCRSPLTLIPGHQKARPVLKSDPVVPLRVLKITSPATGPALQQKKPVRGGYCNGFALSRLDPMISEERSWEMGGCGWYLYC